jgi:polysaccharide chain length determinant protein (PEP-CTERM system associated)
MVGSSPQKVTSAMQMKSQQYGTDTNVLGLPRNPSEYYDILRIRWAWIVVPLILGAIASLVAAYFVPKRYVSRTVVMVESERIPRNFIPQITTEQVRDRLRTVEQEIMARPRLERIVDELDPYPELAVAAGRAYVVELIQSRTLISVRGKDSFVIEYIDTEPERAQQLVTRLASLFIEETTGARERQVQGANEFIDRQLEETRAEMEQLEAELSTLKQRHMGMLPEQLNANLATMQRLQMEHQLIGDKIVSAKERKMMLERQLAIQREMAEPEAQLIPSSPDIANPTTPSEKGRLLEALQFQLSALRKRYTDAHPDVAALQSRIRKLEAELAAEPESQAMSGEPAEVLSQADLIFAELQAQIAAANRDIQKLEKEEFEVRANIAMYQKRVEMIPQVEQKLQAIERDHEMVSKYYSELMNRKLQAETAGDVERRWKEEQFRILDPAQLPDAPVFPRKSIFLVIGTLIGLGVGVGLAFLVEFTDHSIKYPRELQAVLPYPIMLTLPHISQKRSWLHRVKMARVASSPKKKVFPKAAESEDKQKTA